MWKRLPQWMWIGAWLLAFCAGMVNVVGLVDFGHQALTHMTGLTSRLAENIVDQNAWEILNVGTIMICFVSGAIFSGLLIRNSALEWGKRYGVALFIEAIILCLAAVLLKRRLSIGFGVASFACGLQNAMASNFSGSAIRTTHVSGMFTDLGLSIAHWLRGVPIDILRVRVCISTITGFAGGGIVGVLFFRHMGTDTLYIPATITALLALIYRIVRKQRV
jgi:uncharacterized membrane protein YoaK (UPF0700 family)